MQTRVLVTHAVHWLPLADRVVLMREGRVAESGTYLQLMRRDGALCRFLRSALTTTSTEDVDSMDDPEGNYRGCSNGDASRHCALWLAHGWLQLGSCESSLRIVDSKKKYS